jgi:hypothetical protein
VVAGGNHNIGSGINAVVVGGTINEAFGLNSTVSGGTSNYAEGINSGVLAGNNNYSYGINSTVIGGASNRADGDNSIVFSGANNTAKADFSTVSGGSGNTAQSYGEWVGGLNGTEYIPLSLSSFNENDRIFNVGNGVSAAARSDAFTVLKNGVAMLPSATNELIEGELSGKAITTKEYLEAYYARFKSGKPDFPTSEGKKGEIRFFTPYVYFCYADNLWIRTEVSTWP